MTATSLTIGGKANGGAADPAYRTTQGRALVEAVMQKAYELWPVKATHGLAANTGTSPRSVERWSQDKGGISSVALANLIRSEQGFHFLVALMADAQPKWWRMCVPMMEAADAQELQRKARRKIRRVIRGALDADAELTLTIAQADALAIQDPEFTGPYRDALRSMARIPNRAVAKTKK